MAAPNAMNEDIFRQYAVIPRLLKDGCTGIRCEKLRSTRRTDVLCKGPKGQKVLVEVKCPVRIDDMYRAVGQVMFYSIDYPDYIVVLAIPSRTLTVDMVEKLQKRCNIRFLVIDYPDLAKITFTEQVLPAPHYNVDEEEK